MKHHLVANHPGRAMVLDHLIQHLRSLPEDRSYVIEDREERKERTPTQNATLFSVVYPPIMEFMGLRGEKDRLELHEYWCGEYFGWVEYEIMGQRKQRPVRTTTTDQFGKRNVLSRVEFGDFWAFIVQRASEHGIVVPEPDPMYRRKRGAS